MNRALLAVIVAALVAPVAVRAGPPYLTDDPEPVELHHWEVYLASQSSFDGGGFAGTAPHVEVNYGAVPQLQLHLIAPLMLATGGGRSPRYGPGDVELGAKYRFVDEDRAGVQVGTFPLVDLPTGSAARGLGAGGTTMLIPIWIQKSVGPWTTYGGGGYRIRTAPDSHDSWFIGWLLQRKVGPVAIGAEIFEETHSPSTLAGDAGFNVGAVIDVSELHHLLVSFGANQGAPAMHGYLAWQLTFGPSGEPAAAGEHEGH